MSQLDVATYLTKIDRERARLRKMLRSNWPHQHLYEDLLNRVDLPLLRHTLELVAAPINEGEI
jgi:hypothetical protein